MKRSLSLTLTVSAFALMASLSVMAQQASTPSTATRPTAVGKPAAPSAAASPTLDKMTMPVWPQVVVPTLPPVSDAPAPVNFALPQQIEGVKPDLLSGVTAQGYARKVDVDDKTTFGQVLVQSVAKGDKTAVIDAGGGGFTAQFDAKTQSDLKPEKALEVTGSRAALISALEKLNGTVKEKSEEKKTTKETADYGSSNSGSGTKNSQAYGWQVPTENYAKKEDVVNSRTSTDGCTVRIDLPAGEVIQQVKTVTTTNGVDSEGACGDGSQRFKIERDYSACSEFVDGTALKTYPQYKNFYVDASGTNQTFGACEPDRDKAKPILPTTRTSTEGCSVRIDVDAGKAIQQVKTITTLNGVETIGACADGEQTFPIERDYSGCDDLVDMEHEVASAQYKNFYINASGANQTFGLCETDRDKAYPIIEKDGTCLVQPVVSEAKAYRQSVLVYINDKKQETEVRGCAKSEKYDPIPMHQDTAACSLRHNFRADDTGFTDELGQWVYDFDGVTHAASACLGTGRTFPHSKVYQDAAAQNVCQPIVDQAQQLVTLQYRKAITIDGQQQFISECTPDSDPSLRLPVKGTTDGCTNPNGWTHDVAAVVSYGQRRFYFDSPASGRQYITDCITADDLTYPHQHVRTGWENHDEPTASSGGYALPITRVSIDISGTPYTVLSGEVLPGAASVNYVKQADLTAGTGKYSYSGCDKYETTLLTKQFKRPDNTILQVPGGAGANRPMGNACTTSGGLSTADWTFIRARFSSGLESDYGNVRVGCEYQTSRTLVRDDGKTFPGENYKLTLVQGSNVGSRGATGEILSRVEVAPYVSENYPGYSLIRPSSIDYTSPGTVGGFGGGYSCPNNATTSAVSLFRAHLGW